MSTAIDPLDYYRSLFQETKEQWQESKNANYICTELDRLYTLKNLVSLSTADRMHIDRCCWLLSNVDYSHIENENQHSKEDFLEIKRKCSRDWLWWIINEKTLPERKAVEFYLDELETKQKFKREEMVTKIIGLDLAKDDSKKNTWQKKIRKFVHGDQKPLGDYFRDQNGQIDYAGRRHLARIAEWFVAWRFDFKIADGLIKKYIAADKNNKCRTQHLWVSIPLVFVLCFLTYWRPEVFYLFSDPVLRWFLPRPWIMCLSSGLCVMAYALVVAQIIAVFKNTIRIKLSAPRLAAGIVVGYVPLILVKDLWIFLLDSYWPLVLFMALAAALLNYLLLHVRLQELLGRNNETGKRTRRLFVRTMITSLVLGLIFLDLMANGFLLMIPDLKICGLTPGFLGVIPWKILTFIVPVAALAGFILQLVWEDKTITDTWN